MKKKKKTHQKTVKISSDNVLTLTEIKKNPNINVLDVINHNLEKNTPNQNSLKNNATMSFTQLLQNFIDKKNLENYKELKDEKEEINKKLQRLRTAKTQNRSLKNQNNDDSS